MKHAIISFIVLTMILAITNLPGEAKAKNVILFIGDGMGSGQIEASAAGFVAFQEGRQGYRGTRDTYIAQDTPGASRANSRSIEWDTNDPQGSGKEKCALLRFESLFTSRGGPIPDGATIELATLTFTVFNKGDTADLHEVLRNWSEPVTYNAFGGCEPPNTIGAKVGSATDNGVGPKTVDVTTSLQRWADNPGSNRGWIFLPTGNDGVDVRSSEFGTTEHRPRLSVAYTAPLFFTDPVHFPVQGLMETESETTLALSACDPDELKKFISKSTDRLAPLGKSTDSAAGGTAIATGQKVCNGVISTAIPGDHSDLETVLEGYEMSGMVTTDRMTEATAASFGAHAFNRARKEEVDDDFCNVTKPNILFGLSSSQQFGQFFRGVAA